MGPEGVTEKSFISNPLQGREWTKTEGFLLTAKFTRTMSQLNHSVNHPYLGPLAARVAGFACIAFVAIADVFMHLGLTIGKGIAAIPVMPFKCCYRISPDLDISSALIHLTHAVYSLFNITILPFLCLLDPDLAASRTQMPSEIKNGNQRKKLLDEIQDLQKQQNEAIERKLQAKNLKTAKANLQKLKKRNANLKVKINESEELRNKEALISQTEIDKLNAKIEQLEAVKKYIMEEHQSLLDDIGKRIKMLEKKKEEQDLDDASQLIDDVYLNLTEYNPPENNLSIDDQNKAIEESLIKNKASMSNVLSMLSTAPLNHRALKTRDVEKQISTVRALADKGHLQPLKKLIDLETAYSDILTEALIEGTLDNIPNKIKDVIKSDDLTISTCEKLAQKFDSLMSQSISGDLKQLIMMRLEERKPIIQAAQEAFNNLQRGRKKGNLMPSFDFLLSDLKLTLTTTQGQLKMDGVRVNPTLLDYFVAEMCNQNQLKDFASFENLIRDLRQQIETKAKQYIPDQKEEAEKEVQIWKNNADFILAKSIIRKFHDDLKDFVQKTEALDELDISEEVKDLKGVSCQYADRFIVEERLKFINNAKKDLDNSRQEIDNLPLFDSVDSLVKEINSFKEYYANQKFQTTLRYKLLRQLVTLIKRDEHKPKRNGIH